MTQSAGKKAEDFYWYHTIDLGNGEIVQGDYSMEQYLPAYHFPENMTGMKVLDVGRASGFFSFEFERRGAEVTATELRSITEWDYLGGPDKRQERIDSYQKGHPNFDEYMIRGAFFFAHAKRKSTVTPIDANVYDLSPALFGGNTFDMVFAGSIFSHVKNPIGAAECLRSVTKKTCIIAAPSFPVRQSYLARKLCPGLTKFVAHAPLLRFVGRGDDDARSWFTFNASGLIEMLYAAGFKKVTIMSHVDLYSSANKADIPHIIAHAEP